MKPILGKSGTGSVSIDVPRLLETRLLLTASSGGGKSWAIRRLVEQVAGELMVLVIDPEGEFASLRERFDLVIAGKGGDTPADPRSADLLARRLLELGTSAVLDIYELRPADRVRFVRRFLESLLNAPKALWRPCLVVLDEAHAYCPEKGQAESAGAVIDLMSRGRKRGFAGVLATQRLPKLAKDAAAEAVNVLVGRFSLDLDVRRAAETLGFPKDRHQEFKRLKPGEFFAFGPALCEEVTQVRVGKVSTTHPKAGKRQAAPPAPRAQVQAVLEQLADLPAEAEEEARTLGSAQKRVRELERELRQAQRDGGPPDEAVLDRGRREGAAEAERQLRQVVGQVEARGRAVVQALEPAARALEAIAPGIQKAIEAAREPVDVDLSRSAPVQRRVAPSSATERPRAARAEVRRSAPSGDVPGGGAGRMLVAIAGAYPGALTEAQWATLSRLKRTGGTWSTYKSRHVQAGYVEREGSLWRITEDGLAALGETPLPPSSPEELVEQWKAAVGGGAARLLDVILAEGPIARETLAEEAGLAASGGTFSTYLSRLRSNGLIEDDGGGIRAATILLEGP